MERAEKTEKRSRFSKIRAKSRARSEIRRHIVGQTTSPIDITVVLSPTGRSLTRGHCRCFPSSFPLFPFLPCERSRRMVRGVITIRVAHRRRKRRSARRDLRRYPPRVWHPMVLLNDNGRLPRSSSSESNDARTMLCYRKAIHSWLWFAYRKFWTSHSEYAFCSLIRSVSARDKPLIKNLYTKFASSR